MTWTCERCGLEYEEAVPGEPDTQVPHTCDDCGGPVEEGDDE